MGFAEQIKAELIKLRERRDQLINEIKGIDSTFAEYTIAMRVAQKFSHDIGVEPKQNKHPTYGGSESSDTTSSDATWSGSLKSLVLHILLAAYPTGLRAAKIRKIAAREYHTEINPNSLTVALGRFKASGETRIDGRMWYFVPPQHRQTLAGTAQTIEHFTKQTGAPDATDAPEIDGEPPSSSGRTPDLPSGEAGSKPAGGTTS